MESNYYMHLSKEERKIIERGVSNNSRKCDIASTLGKDPSTIGKEIKLHRYVAYSCKLPLQCKNYKKCKHGRNCKSDCLDYEEFKCSRRDRSPGACNGCKNYQSCRFTKYKYDADIADNEYKESLVNNRQGFNITTLEVKRIGEILMPLLKNGQSIEQILMSHKEIELSTKTIYTYIENSLFKDVGIDITVMDLRRQVSRRLPKKKVNLYKKRTDSAFLNGRTYKDYKSYIEESNETSIVEMDSVYNDITNGPFIETFKFKKYGLLFAVLHKEKTEEAMNDGVLLLESVLGEELFNKEVRVLLTDRGSEFYGIHRLETRIDGTARTRVFYCDPMASHQKGSLENKHEELRYICPKESDLYKLGLKDQSKLNLVLSHINSSPRKKLNGKSPIELLKFLCPDMAKKLSDFGITEIEKDKVILKPFLLK